VDTEKYNRTVSLLCPTCGGSLFEGADDPSAEMVTCATCDRSLTRDELLQENSENIGEHLEEIKKSVKKDLTKQLQDTLKSAFKGSKNIKFK
jgi:uncharacterized Zn finger protein (UPF0148 family)